VNQGEGLLGVGAEMSEDAQSGLANTTDERRAEKVTTEKLAGGGTTY
jgi:hypothetical protein